jgi:pimeloyl-ACP methyl ester carboxylesterase
MSEFPTLVFTPGAWHQPTCYNKVTKALKEQYNIHCTSFPLPSTSGNPKATFKNDLDAARTAIARETTQGRDVVLIAHSYGGMVANSAIKGFTNPRGEDLQGRIVGLVLIASGFTLSGLSFMDPFFHIPPPTWRVNKETGFADFVTPPRQLFYHDLPEEEAGEWVKQLSPQSLKALFEGGEHSYAGWRDVPVWYIGTVEDQGLPVVAQRVNVGMAREMGAAVVHRELRSSHSPFLSQPDEVVELLVEATRAFSGCDLKSKEIRGGGREVLVPEVDVRRPETWIRYALPYFIGRVVGRCVLLFYGIRRLWAGSADAKAKTI